MKKKEVKELKREILTDVKKALKSNNGLLADKLGKLVRESITPILKKSREKVVVAANGIDS